MKKKEGILFEENENDNSLIDNYEIERLSKKYNINFDNNPSNKIKVNS